MVKAFEKSWNVVKEIKDPYDILEHYPHALDCEEFAQLIPTGMIGSEHSEWSFCPFCGDYI